METASRPAGTPSPGGNLYVGPPLGRSLARLALALAAAPRPEQAATES